MVDALEVMSDTLRVHVCSKIGVMLVSPISSCFLACATGPIQGGCCTLKIFKQEFDDMKRFY